jgi:hypothetical protein
VIALVLTFVLGLQGIPLQAQQAGRVSGILKDSQGQPLAGIRMAALARPLSLDEAVTSAAMSSLAETDEQGRYTLESIPPGRYYIAAGRLDAQTYYPGTADLAMAKEVTVAAGATILGIDFALGDLSFGRAYSGGISTVANLAIAIPLRVTVDGGGKLPVSARGKFVTVKLDMGTSILSVPIGSASFSIPGPQTTAYNVTVENLPENYQVKSLTYGTTDLRSNTLRLVPSNFPSARTVAVPGPSMASANSPVAAQIPQMVSIQQAQTPPSDLKVTLVRVPSKTDGGIRVSGRLHSPGKFTVYVSDIPGTVYSDATFDVYGVPPGRHSIVTPDVPSGLRPLAASVVVANDDVDGIVLPEVTMLPIRAREPSAPRPAGDHPVGPVRLARVTGTLIEENSRKVVPEGTVTVRTNGYYSASFPVDDEGHFELPPLLPGSYDLEIQIFGHSNVKRSVEVDDKDLKLEIATRKLY